jgi:two-component system, sensor histidine kinase and response regulator
MPSWRTHAYRAVVAISLAVLALFAACLIFQWGGLRTTQLIDDVVLPLAPLVAAGASSWAAIRLRGRRRLAWLLIAASCLAWGLGESVWGYYDAVLHNQLPFPSLADAGYLSEIPLAVAGLLCFRSFRDSLAVELASAVDALVIACSLFTVSWTLLLGAVYASSAQSTLASTISMAYPVSDVVIVTLAVYMSFRARSWARRSIMLLAFGFVLNAFADSSFTYLTATGRYVTGNPIDSLWLAGFVLIGLGALSQTWEPITGRLELPASTVNGVAATAAISLALITLVGARINQPLDPVTAVAILVIAGLLLVRWLVYWLSNRAASAKHREAMATLEQTEGILWDVTQQAPFGFFATDSSGKLALAVGAALEHLRPAAAKLVGEPVHKLLGDKLLEDAFAKAARGTATTVVTTRWGTELELTMAPRRDAKGKIGGVSAVVVDVDDFRRAERAQRDSEARLRFLAHITHELRTPLNAILGFAGLLEVQSFGALNEKQGRYLQNITTSGRSLLSLVNDLLDSAKMAAGKMEFRIDVFDISLVARRALATLESLADQKQVTLVWEGADDLLCSGDPRRSEQVLLNLLSNALKFTEARTRVSVAVRANLDSVAISVTDSGMGIAADQVERIFDEYAQVDDGGRQATKGTGLGLPLSRQMAEMMNGSLNVTSVVGEGSVFTFILPASPPPASLAKAG